VYISKEPELRDVS